ncbi:MAG TPA: hypothetical protein VE291_04980 [Terracidiphilus sp.]|jgi:hypothetical protein|nr:hypothetical protein [Terracidiphilus sp.]
MRRLFVALLLCFCSLAVTGQKTRFGQAPRVKAGVDYPLKMHVSGIHIRTIYVSPSWIGPDFLPSERNQDIVYVDAEIDGRKIELLGPWTWISGSYQTPLSTGDFQARLVKDTPKTSAPPIGQQYEIVLPGGIAWRGVVTGITE